MKFPDFSLTLNIFHFPELFPLLWQPCRRELHGQVSLAALYRINVIHEAIKGSKKSKDLLKNCFENVNIKYTEVCMKFSYGKNLTQGMFKWKTLCLLFVCLI